VSPGRSIETENGEFSKAEKTKKSLKNHIGSSLIVSSTQMLKMKQTLFNQKYEFF
jgi:hypothetical protein